MCSDSARDGLYFSLAQKIPISREDFESTFSDYDICHIMIGDLKAGYMITKGNEIHMELDKFISLRYAKKIIFEYLKPMLDKFGELKTISRLSDRIFLERIGFQLSGEIDGMDLMVLSKIKLLRD